MSDLIAYLYMGLWSQVIMDQVLEGVEQFSAAFSDDIVIFSDDWSDHLTHLRAMLLQLNCNGLAVKARKCQLVMECCGFLGRTSVP